jgi:hypothetical protein
VQDLTELGLGFRVSTELRYNKAEKSKKKTYHHWGSSAALLCHSIALWTESETNPQIAAEIAVEYGTQATHRRVLGFGCHHARTAVEMGWSLCYWEIELPSQMKTSCTTEKHSQQTSFAATDSQREMGMEVHKLLGFRVCNVYLNNKTLKTLLIFN